MNMKKKKITLSLLFTLLFAVGAGAQDVAAAPAADAYNGLKSLAVLALMIIALVYLYYRSKPKAAAPVVEAVEDPEASVPDEVVAAIVMMLNDMDEDVHDRDNTILTMRKVTRNYSPWNSKLFGMRQIPPKK
jgi:hypothetical protein